MAKNNRKKNRNKNDNGIVMREVKIPNGTLTESFKKYIANDKSDSKIISFLSVKNAGLLLKCQSLDNFSDSERQELYEFYTYFMENFGEKTYKARMENWGQEPLIFRLTQALYDDDCCKADEKFMKEVSDDIMKEAENLCNKIFPIRKDRHFSCIIPTDSWEFWVTKTIPKKHLQDTKDYMILSFAKIIAKDGYMCVRMHENNAKDMMFGIAGKDGKWIPVSKEDIEKADKESQKRYGISEDMEYMALTKD